MSKKIKTTASNGTQRFEVLKPDCLGVFQAQARIIENNINLATAVSFAEVVRYLALTNPDGLAKELLKLSDRYDAANGVLIKRRTNNES